MDKVNRNFDATNATKDSHGNITARNQNGLTAEMIGPVLVVKRKRPMRYQLVSGFGGRDKNCKLVPTSSL